MIADAASERGGISRRAVATVAVLSLALLLGAYLRLYRAAPADFPVNDGGLFYLMTEELRAAHYSLPVFTSYNGAGIPFAYPPLGFYLAAVLADLTGAPPSDVMRLLPGVVSILAIPAFYLLARALAAAEVAALATLIFALLPRTYIWFVMGGGLTRAPGFLFALLMLQQTYLMYTRRRTRHAAGTALFGALALLSHAENAWFAVHSALLMFLFFGRHRHGVVHSVLVAAAVALLASPWWATVIHHHGVAPFLALASGGGYGNFSATPLASFSFTDEPYLTVLGVLGLVGAFKAVAARRYFVPAWLLWIFLVNPRNPETVAAVPLAMLAALALAGVILPAIRAEGVAAGGMALGPPSTGGGEGPGRGWPGARFPSLVAAALLAYVVAYSFSGARAVGRGDDSGRVLSGEERDAMRWAATHTPDSARFLVLDAKPGWFGLDATAEWFPVLARRRSVTTPQGYEWLPGGAFFARIGHYKSARACLDLAVACLDDWRRRSAQPFDYVYLRASDRGASLVASLRASPAYSPVYEGGGAIIFARRVAPGVAPGVASGARRGSGG